MSRASMSAPPCMSTLTTSPCPRANAMCSTVLRVRPLKSMEGSAPAPTSSCTTPAWPCAAEVQSICPSPSRVGRPALLFAVPDTHRIVPPLPFLLSLPLPQQPLRMLQLIPLPLLPMLQIAQQRPQVSQRTPCKRCAPRETGFLNNFDVRWERIHAASCQPCNHLLLLQIILLKQLAPAPPAAATWCGSGHSACSTFVMCCAEIWHQAATAHAPPRCPSATIGSRSSPPHPQ